MGFAKFTKPRFKMRKKKTNELNLGDILSEVLKLHRIV